LKIPNNNFRILIRNFHSLFITINVKYNFIGKNVTREFTKPDINDKFSTKVTIKPDNTIFDSVVANINDIEE
jgi:hypothetical protein